MPIVQADLSWRLSVLTGAAGNTTAGTPAGSLGKYISTTAYTTATNNNVWDDISAAENAALTVEYRLIFVLNNHASLTATAPKFFLLSETAGGANIAISVDTTGVTAKGSAPAQAKQIASETTAPTSQSFSSPTTIGTALSGIADIPAGSVQGIWIRRTATASAAQADGVVIRCEVTSAP